MKSSLLTEITENKDLAELTIQKKVNNPYLNAKRTWNGHVAGLMASNKMWQVIGILGLLTGLASVGGMIHIGSQSKFIPLVFREDAAGNMLSITRADKIPDAKIDDYRTVAIQFIENIRMVTVDTDLQRKAILKTYAFMQQGDVAISKANEFLNGNKEVNPFNRAANEMVQVEIQSVLQQTKESWQVDWIEGVRGRDGTLKEKYQMRAILNLYQSEFEDNFSDMEALQNPHLIFVRDFNWSKQR